MFINHSNSLYAINKKYHENFTWSMQSIVDLKLHKEKNSFSIKMEHENISVLHVCLELKYSKEKNIVFSFFFLKWCVFACIKCVCPRTNSNARTLSTCLLLIRDLVIFNRIISYRCTCVDILEVHQRRRKKLHTRVGSVRENKCHRCSSHTHKFHKSRTIEMTVCMCFFSFIFDKHQTQREFSSCFLFLFIYSCLLFNSLTH